MSYELDFQFEEVLRELTDKFSILDVPIFTETRPEATKGMEQFIRLSMPNNMRSSTYGGGYGNVNTFLTVEVYTRMKKTGIVNIPLEAQLVKEVMKMFPITGEYIVVSQPRPQLKGIDSTGFSVTLIRTKITLK